jgi:hypothetical protein
MQHMISKVSKMSKDVSNTLFEGQAKSPEFWFGNAECFKWAASKLLEQAEIDETVDIGPDGEGGYKISTQASSPPLGGVITVLLGLTIENQVKAIVIALKAEDFVKDGELDGKFITHNLRELIGKANSLRPNLIRLKGLKDWTKLLDKLASAVVWGKYGIPRTSKRKKTTKESQTLNRETFNKPLLRICTGRGCLLWPACPVSSS